MDKMWCMLMQLGDNMWAESKYTKRMLRDPETWNWFCEYEKEAGVNTVIIDVGEGMRFDAYPELASENSLTKDEMRAEIGRLRKMGFEVVPKLNFSTCHDGWLGEYSHMVSTSKYYEVCRTVIREICEVFQPRYFHIGMDEEDMPRPQYRYVVIRQGELWWHDLYYLVDCVESQGARAWVWSDYVWEHKDEYLAKMPRSVLQSPWYYWNQFSDFTDPTEERRRAREHMVQSFSWLAESGYDLVPTGSNWGTHENMEILTRYCAEKLEDQRILGFMQTPWHECTPQWKEYYRESADTLREAKKWYDCFKTGK